MTKYDPLYIFQEQILPFLYTFKVDMTLYVSLEANMVFDVHFQDTFWLKSTPSGP